MNNFVEVPANKSSISKRKLVYGRGINNATYIVSPTIKGKRTWCPYFKTWMAMLTRCYSKKHLKRNTTYAGCSVCKDWLTFSVFKNWMMLQNWCGNQLDKDIIHIGNKVYCPTYCVFVPNHINLAVMQPKRTKHTHLPTGVNEYMTGEGMRYIVTLIRHKQPTINKGGFLTSKEANNYYKQLKYDHLLYLATTVSDVRVSNGLVNWAIYMFNK